MKNNKTLWLFIILFILPFALATVALKFDWVEGGSSNHGELMTQEVHLPGWEAFKPKGWTIVLPQSQECGQPCEVQRKGMENIYLALGKLQDKVSLAVLSDSPQSGEGEIKAIQASSLPLNSGSLYLVDHMGLVVLHYPYLDDPQENRLQHKGLMKDLKKLLNYSRSS